MKISSKIKRVFATTAIATLVGSMFSGAVLSAVNAAPESELDNNTSVLSINKTADKTSVKAGDTVVWTIDVGCSSNTTLCEDAILVDELPEYLTYKSIKVDESLAEVNVDGNTVTARFLQEDENSKVGLLDGTSIRVEITTTVNNNIPAEDTSISNTAKLVAGDVNSETLKESTATVEFVHAVIDPDVSITKRVNNRQRTADNGILTTPYEVDVQYSLYQGEPSKLVVNDTGITGNVDGDINLGRRISLDSSQDISGIITVEFVLGGTDSGEISNGYAVNFSNDIKSWSFISNENVIGGNVKFTGTIKSDVMTAESSTETQNTANVEFSGQTQSDYDNIELLNPNIKITGSKGILNSAGGKLGSEKGQGTTWLDSPNVISLVGQIDPAGQSLTKMTLHDDIYRPYNNENAFTVGQIKEVFIGVPQGGQIPNHVRLGATKRNTGNNSPAQLRERLEVETIVTDSHFSGETELFNDSYTLIKIADKSDIRYVEGETFNARQLNTLSRVSTEFSFDETAQPVKYAMFIVYEQYDQQYELINRLDSGRNTLCVGVGVGDECENVANIPFDVEIPNRDFISNDIEPVRKKTSPNKSGQQYGKDVTFQLTANTGQSSDGLWDSERQNTGISIKDNISIKNYSSGYISNITVTGDTLKDTVLTDFMLNNEYVAEYKDMPLSALDNLRIPFANDVESVTLQIAESTGLTRTMTDAVEFKFDITFEKVCETGCEAAGERLYNDADIIFYKGGTKDSEDKTSANLKIGLPQPADIVSFNKESLNGNNVKNGDVINYEINSKNTGAFTGGTLLIKDFYDPSKMTINDDLVLEVDGQVIPENEYTFNSDNTPNASGEVNFSIEYELDDDAKGDFTLTYSGTAHGSGGTISNRAELNVRTESKESQVVNVTAQNYSATNSKKEVREVPLNGQELTGIYNVETNNESPAEAGQFYRYPNLVKTLPNGKSEWRLSTTNISGEPLQRVVTTDFLTDTDSEGITVPENVGTTWTPKLDGPVTVTDGALDSEVFYITKRTDITNLPNGTVTTNPTENYDWKTEAEIDGAWDTVVGFQVVSTHDTERLEFNESVVVTYTTTNPAALALDIDNAPHWNTFNKTTTNDGATNNQSEQPRKAGITMETTGLEDTKTSITVEKLVEGIQAIPEDTVFTIEYAFQGTEGTVSDTVTITDGDTITIENLPVGVEVTITEATAEIDGFKWTLDISNTTVLTDIDPENNHVTVTNTYEPYVTPIAPELDENIECGVERNVIVPEDTDSITYSETREGNTVTVTATPTEGYAFTEDTQNTWTIEIPEVTACGPEVTPIEPTVTENNTCGVPETVIIPNQEGVTYTQSASEDGKTITVIATPDEGYTFTENAKTEWVLTIPEIEECETEITVEPIEPTLSAIEECGVETKVIITETEGITYTQERTGNTVKVTATADEGYVLKEGSKDTWTFKITKEECASDITVEAITPTLSAIEECGVETKVIITETEGVTYTQKREGNTVTVTATADEGYVLKEGSKDTWTFEITKKECEEPKEPTDPKDPTDPTDPDTPKETEDPDTPKDNSDKGETKKETSDESKKKSTEKLVKTGADVNAGFIALGATALIGGGALVATARRRKTQNS